MRQIYLLYSMLLVYIKYHESNDEVVVLDDYPKKHIEEVEQILDQMVGKSKEERTTINIW